MKNIIESILIEEAIACKSYTGGTTDPDPVEVDVQMCEKVAGIIDCGTLGGTISFKLQECDTTTGTFTDISDSTASGTLTAAGILVLEGRPTKKYVKILPTQVATKLDVFGAVIIGINAPIMPIT